MSEITYEQAQKYAEIVTKYMVDNRIKRCLCCQASMSKSTHHITRVMVDSLLKVCRSVAIKKMNDIRIDRLPWDLALTHIERCNFHKLRMHALVAKVRIDGKIKSGRWLVTRRGWQFIQAKVMIPKTVYSFRNHIVSKSPEMVTVKDVVGHSPYCETVDDQLFTPVSEEEIERVEAKSHIKKKKRRNPCPNCDTGEIRNEPITAPSPDSNTLYLVGNREICNRCGWKKDVHSGY